MLLRTRLGRWALTPPSRPRTAGEMWSAGETMEMVVQRNPGRVPCDPIAPVTPTVGL